MNKMNTLNAMKTAGVTVGLGALKLMKIGATQTAIQTLTESNRGEIKRFQGDTARGYEYNVKPNLHKLKVIKGRKN